MVPRRSRLDIGRRRRPDARDRTAPPSIQPPTGPMSRTTALTPSEMSERMTMLLAHRKLVEQQLAGLRHSIDLIDHKLDYYRKSVTTGEVSQ